MDDRSQSEVRQPSVVKATHPPGPIATLGELHRWPPHWLWAYCGNHLCKRSYRATPLALAPYVIRWGANASSDMLRRSARCTVCGHKGARLIVAPDDPDRDNYAVFPGTALNGSGEMC